MCCKKSNAFKGYAISYKVEIIESKDHLVQLEARKSCIKDLFRDLLNDMKGFEYQITMTVLLYKHKMMKIQNIHLFILILQL